MHARVNSRCSIAMAGEDEIAVRLCGLTLQRPLRWMEAAAEAHADDGLWSLARRIGVQ